MLNSLVNLASLLELEKHFQVHWRSSSALALACVLGCAPSPLPDGERRVALQQTTEQVILPTYADLSHESGELSLLLDELANAPEAAALAAAREQYLATRAPLKESEAFGFGPAVELHAGAALDFAPIDAAKIDAALSSDAELSSDELGLLGANKRGLHAIEYLLFPAGDAELEQALLADDVAGQRRRQFLRSAAQLVAESAVELETAWQPDGGGYARRFSEPGAPDSVASNVQAGLDTLLNECVFLSELVADGKLGKPLGGANGGAVDPGAQESERSGASLSDILGNLRGVRNVYLGTRDGSLGTSLSLLVRAKSPSADLHALAALDDAEAQVLAVPEPLTVALRDAPETVNAAYDAIKLLKHVLATEVLGSLGASLKFNANDGD